jgi:predicted ferric reductase
MEHPMYTITGSTALWYASRATGVVSLLLLSLVVMLGILVNRQGRLPGLPSFAVTGLHRSLSLLSVLFIAVHVATAVIDPYVSIRLAAVVIPFVSAYEPFWLGLGAVALDLVAALILTSLARARISRRTWRGIHWLAYAAWPVALVHGIGSSPDLRSGGLLLVAIGSALAVAAAGLWRVAAAAREVPRAERAAHMLAGIQRQAHRARAGHGGAR